MKPTLGRVVHVKSGPRAPIPWVVGVVVFADETDTFTVRVLDPMLDIPLPRDFNAPLSRKQEGETWRWPPRDEGPTFDAKGT